LSFQEFMVIPAMSFSYEGKLEVGAKCYEALAKKLHSEGYSTGVGDEGGFAPKGLTKKEHYLNTKSSKVRSPLK